MILVYIENIQYLKKIVNYLDNTNIKYTTDLNLDHDYLLISELNKKVLELALKEKNNGKKIIFLAYKEEQTIAYYSGRQSKKSKEYFNKLNKIIDISSKIFVHFEFTRKFILKNNDKEIYLIPNEIPIINISKTNKDIYNKYDLKKRNKKIIITDINYKNIDILHSLSFKYPKYNFIYMGYNPDYNLSFKQKNLLNDLPKNVLKIKYYDLNVFSDLAKISDIIIFTEDKNINIDYMYTILLFRKQMIIKQNNLFEDFYINSKNSYIYNNKKDLELKFKKIIESRVSNLTDNAYLLIKEATFDEIIKKYNAYLN